MFTPCWINFVAEPSSIVLTVTTATTKKQQKTDPIKTTPFPQASVATLAQKSHCKSTDRAKYSF